MEILLPPRFSGSQKTHWVTKPLSLHSPLSSLFVCLFVCYLIYSACMRYSATPFCSTVLAQSSSSSSSHSFSYIPSHLACSSSISKQTHFLLTLSSVAVICCACQVEYWATLWPLSTKGRPRKPEGRRYLCIGWIISPTRHSAFSHCLVCNRHAACWCQDSSLVASTRHNACHALPNLLW